MNEKRRLLLNLRDNKPQILYPNYWSFIGGGVQKGESLTHAILREVREEIEYDVEKKDLSFIGIFDDPYGNHVHVYKTGIEKNLNDLKLNEGQRLDFFSFEEVLNLKVPECLKDFLIKNKEKI